MLCLSILRGRDIWAISGFWRMRVLRWKHCPLTFVRVLRSVVSGCVCLGVGLLGRKSLCVYLNR